MTRNASMDEENVRLNRYFRRPRQRGWATVAREISARQRSKWRCANVWLPLLTVLAIVEFYLLTKN